MKVEVEYTGPARAAAGCRSESLQLPEPSSTADLLRALAQARGDALRRLLVAEDGAPRPLLLFVNGAQAAVAPPQPLKDGDRVLLLFPISGG